MEPEVNHLCLQSGWVWTLLIAGVFLSLAEVQCLGFCLGVGAHQVGIWMLWSAKCARGNANTSPGVCYSSVPTSKSLVVEKIMESTNPRGWINAQSPTIPQHCPHTSVQGPKCHIPLGWGHNARCVGCLWHLLPPSLCPTTTSCILPLFPSLELWKPSLPIREGDCFMPRVQPDLIIPVSFRREECLGW